MKWFDGSVNHCLSGIKAISNPALSAIIQAILLGFAKMNWQI
jgi:hypothetical protein